MGKIFEQIYLQRRHTNSKEHIKIHLALPQRNPNQNHSIPTSMAIVKKQDNNSVDADTEKLKSSHIAGGMQSGVAAFWKTVFQFLRVGNIAIPYASPILILNIHSREIKCIPTQNLYPNVVHKTLFIRSKNYKQLKMFIR